MIEGFHLCKHKIIPLLGKGLYCTECDKIVQDYEVYRTDEDRVI